MMVNFYIIIKCSNGISCLLYKNKSQTKGKENINNINKSECEIDINSFVTENKPLKKII